MTAENLLVLILFVAPGFIALEIFRHSYPVRERNIFFQTTWSIIWGLSILGFVRFIDSHFLKSLLNSNSKEFPSLGFIAVLFFTGVLFGCIFILTNKIRDKLSEKFPKLKIIASDPKRIWTKILASPEASWAVIYTDDNAIYLGWIKYYIFDPNIENQDFLLANAKRVDDELNIMYNVTGVGVYLNLKNVKRIEFLEGEMQTNNSDHNRHETEVETS